MWWTKLHYINGPNLPTWTLNPFRVLPSSDNNNHQSCQQAKSWPSKESSCEEVVFFFTNLFHTSCNSSPKKAFIGFLFSSNLSFSACTIAKTLFVLTKKVGHHCGGWDVSSTCMKTIELHSCCLELTLMFVLKFLLAKGVLLPPNLLSLFVGVVLCIGYWIIEALVCFIAMCKKEVHCKHGVHQWFQTTLVCLCFFNKTCWKFLVHHNPKKSQEHPWDYSQNLHQISMGDVGWIGFCIVDFAHLCFCDFQLINGLNFRVHACMFTITTCKELWASEPWRDIIAN